MVYFFKRLSDGQYFTFDTNEPRVGYIEVTEAEVIEAANAVPVLVVPQEITMRHFRHGLLAGGFLGAIDREVKRDDTFEGKAVQIEWAFADTVQRESDLVTTLTSYPTVSMNDDQINQAFIVGATL